MNSIKDVEQYFTHKEIEYLLPLLKRWCVNENECLHWFKTHTIKSCDNLTPYELCNSGKKDLFLMYVKHIELGGFS
jgi:hypothetical protein